MAKEVKSAALISRSDGNAVLVVVDENYEIHQLSAEIETLRLILQNIELPNFEWRHSSDGMVFYSNCAGYQGRYRGNGLSLVRQYEKSDDAA